MAFPANVASVFVGDAGDCGGCFSSVNVSPVKARGGAIVGSRQSGGVSATCAAHNELGEWEITTNSMKMPEMNHADVKKGLWLIELWRVSRLCSIVMV